MGKTANGAIWLNKDQLSDWDFWQYWRNTEDLDVIKFLKLFTELPISEIKNLKIKGAEINEAKIILGMKLQSYVEVQKQPIKFLRLPQNYLINPKQMMLCQVSKLVIVK